MATTQIALFIAPGGRPEDAVGTASKPTQTSSKQDSVAGFHIQDRSIVQVTSETNSREDSSLLRRLRTSCGQPMEIYHLALNQPALEIGGPATSPVLEVVANYFPASRITPEFQKQIEADFLKFDGICRSVAEGDGGLAYGWSVEELDYGEGKGEKTRPFFILRGWRSVQDFENLTRLEKFQKDATPILMAWKAPFKMWHVERKD